MKATAKTAKRGHRGLVALVCGSMLIAAAAPAHAAACTFPPQGEGRVADVIDARTLRLQDGREIRLAGIEPAAGGRADGAAALSAIVAGRDVTLSGDDDTPDRYGRQPAFVYLASSETPVQSELLAKGEALVSSSVTDKACAQALMAAEGAAREAKQGVWAGPTAIKNTESRGDILSVRQAGATTYLNFGRNWTRDFAVTIPKRMVGTFEAAGIGLKSLENRRIRVRGFIEARGGPRIEALRVGQIELLGGN
jgi:endonuclease YncB( thermonuclease family)